MKQKISPHSIPETKNVYCTSKFKWVSFVYEGIKRKKTSIPYQKAFSCTSFVSSGSKVTLDIGT